MSLARLGASMTGLDLSAPAVEAARQLAERTAADARFVQADLYAAPNVLGRGGFDLVFTGIGALCWLPDIGRWAEVVAAPGRAAPARPRRPLKASHWRLGPGAGTQVSRAARIRSRSSSSVMAAASLGRS